MTLHVARLCPEYYTGKAFNRGLTLNLYYLIRELEKLGVHHHLFTPKTNADHQGTIPITTIPLRGRFTIYRQGIDAYHTFQTHKKYNYDLIHTHNYGFFNLYRYKKKLNKPMIHSIHGSPFDIKYHPLHSFRHFKEMMYAYLFTKYIVKRADAIIVMTMNYKRDMVKYYHTDPAKIHFIPPQVDAKLFMPKQCQKDIDLLYTGRFVTLKQVPFAVEVTRILKQTKPDISTYFVGGGPGDEQYHEVIALIKKHKLEHNITIVPPVDHKKLVEYYNRSKVNQFVALSHGVGKTILESMACGVPYVTNMHPAEGKASFTNKEGYASLPLKPDVFAEKILTLLEDEPLRRKLGNAARKKVETYYTPQVTAKKTRKIYDNALS